MATRATLALLLLLASAGPLAAQGAAPPADLPTLVTQLSSLDYPVRMNAARLIRRAPAADAVKALTAAVRGSKDQFVRYRALVVLTSFNDRATGELVRDLLADPNERVREVSFRWLEQHPDPQLLAPLLSALQTETAEFVRPALVGAVAAFGSDPQVQRALLVEVSRGLDFFRSAVIDTLGRHRAAYAVEAIAAVSMLEGPLQDDAVLALGRLGGPRAEAALAALTNAPADVQLAVRAARCLAGQDCDAPIKALSAAATATNATTGIVRAAVAGLAAVAAGGRNQAFDAILALARAPGPLRDQAAVGLASAAIRQPDRVLAWLNAASDTVRTTAFDLLKDGFDRLEDDYAEEQFYAAARASYWAAPEKSPGRDLAATLIQRLEF